jgi:hypothetical protein
MKNNINQDNNTNLKEIINLMDIANLILIIKMINLKAFFMNKNMIIKMIFLKKILFNIKKNLKKNPKKNIVVILKKFKIYKIWFKVLMSFNLFKILPRFLI